MSQFTHIYVVISSHTWIQMNKQHRLYVSFLYIVQYVK